MLMLIACKWLLEKEERDLHIASTWSGSLAASHLIVIKLKELCPGCENRIRLHEFDLKEKGQTNEAVEIMLDSVRDGELFVICGASTEETPKGPKPLSFNDVFIVTTYYDLRDEERDDDIIATQASGLLKGLKQAGVPYRVVVVWVQSEMGANTSGDTDFGRLDAWSRTTAQLVFAEDKSGQCLEDDDYLDLVARFLCGPPGTGKTVVLMLIACKWLLEKEERDLHIVSTWSGGASTEATPKGPKPLCFNDVFILTTYYELIDEKRDDDDNIVTQASGLLKVIVAEADTIRGLERKVVVWVQSEMGDTSGDIDFARLDAWSRTAAQLVKVKSGKANRKTSTSQQIQN
nr:hypothetical protein BaRGS_013017 [Batillaria attramentaria]